MIFKGQSGKTYNVNDTPIDDGAEGEIYAIKGNNNSLIKILKQGSLTPLRISKLKAMVDMSSSIDADILGSISWPTDLIISKGNITGFVMPKIENAKTLLELESHTYNLDLHERVKIAYGLCGVVVMAHDIGASIGDVIIGDLNPKNIMVNLKTYRVSLIDTDSFYIKHKNKTYKCTVGFPEYYPHEIQKYQRTCGMSAMPDNAMNMQSDNFALAVNIFELLIGVHPFTQRSSTSIPPEPRDNIYNGDFKFHLGDDSKNPKHGLRWDALNTELQNLFIRAFKDGFTDPSARPNEIEWAKALMAYGKTITKNKSICANHKYPSHMKYCPFCGDNIRSPRAYNKVLKDVPNPNFKTANVTVTGTTTGNTSGNTSGKTSGTTSGKTSSNTSGKTSGTTSSNNGGIKVVNPTPPTPKKTKLFSKPFVFWLIALLIPAFAHIGIYTSYGEEIVNSFFGGVANSGIETIVLELLAMAGYWGFVIVGYIGTFIYNLAISKGKLKGYTIKDYILTLLFHGLSATIGFYLLILACYLIGVIIGLVLFIAVICGFMSGS